MNTQTIETESELAEMGLAPAQHGQLTKAPSLPTPQQNRDQEIAKLLEPAYQKASTLELSNAEIAALTAPFPDEAVEIRPHDGLIYLPHIEISNRLNAVLKPGKWALICRRHWLEGQTMYGEYILLIRGCFVGESVGGHPYIASNPKTNYSDTLESTAAEALRRICGKRLSCGSQCWIPEYARQWVAKHAVLVNGKWQKQMNRNAAPPSMPQPASRPPQTPPTKPAPAPPAPPEPKQAPMATEEQRTKMILQLKAEPGGENHAIVTEYFCKAGCLLPTENLADLPLHYVPSTANHMRELGLWIAGFTNGAPVVKPNWHPSGLLTPEAKPVAKIGGDEAWRTFIVPIPRKGMKRDEYLKSPDTIGSLYDNCHGNDEESTACRQRLFGFVHHFQPTGWKKRDGTEMPPSDTDYKFRTMLDQFKDWHTRNHPDDKL